MNTIKIRVNFEENRWQIKVVSHTTVAQLIYKLRRYAKLKDHEAIFLFFKYNGLFCREKMYANSRTLAQIQAEIQQDILEVNMIKESTFGAWNRGFLSAKIEKKRDLFVVTIKWSWYGLTSWSEVEVFETLEEAKSYVLKERCQGGLTLSL